MKMFLFFSHKLTNEQIEDAKKSLKIDEFVYLPKDLQEIFSNIPPEAEELKEIIRLFENFLFENSNIGDYALIQGDFGVVYNLVSFAKSIGVVPVYSTTKRISKEIEIDGKIQKISEFRHVRFRRY